MVDKLCYRFLYIEPDSTISLISFTHNARYWRRMGKPPPLRTTVSIAQFGTRDMNQSGAVGLHTMKPFCRILITSTRVMPFFTSPTLIRRHSIHGVLQFRPKCIGIRGGTVEKEPPLCLKCRGFSDWFNARSHRGIFVCSSFRHYSTPVGAPRVNGNNFERDYVQDGVNVKPSAVEENHSSDPVDVGNKQGHKKQVSGIEKEAWKLLRKSVVTYCGSPVGTLAANNPGDNHPLNYDQVFIRDFIPSALAFLLNGEAEIVKNFLLHTLQLQSWEKTVDCHSPGKGLMPASFKVRTVPTDGSNVAFEEVSDPDFGESAIGRVAPVDSGLWWIILLRSYGKITGDYGLQERVDIQTGIKLILNLCLAAGFDMFPSLLVTDGSCMIDRRMGIHGHPLEIQIADLIGFDPVQKHTLLKSSQLQPKLQSIA